MPSDFFKRKNALRCEFIVVYTNVFAIMILFPYGDLVVASGHGQHVACKWPTHMPGDAVEFVQHCWFPNAQRVVACIIQIRRPYDDFTALYRTQNQPKPNKTIKINLLVSSWLCSFWNEWCFETRRHREPIHCGRWVSDRAPTGRIGPHAISWPHCRNRLTQCVSHSYHLTLTGDPPVGRQAPSLLRCSQSLANN